MILYALTIVVSAFLLFQVQPVIAKIILPWFGGSAAVWTTCLLFFQMVLLLGYAYAHATIRYLTPRIQMLVHAGLLALSALVLPIYPNASWKPLGNEDPSLRILGLLAVTVGLPYFLLSTTGPLLQAWYARRYKGSIPYRLYALSNAGSMFALLSYPVLFEPVYTTHQQSDMWSVAYVVFAVLCAVTAFQSGTAPIAETAVEGGGAHKPAAAQYWMWMGLAACASTLLLAITNHMSQNIAAIPFLWILPLSIYLLSFILCFEGSGWYRRTPYLQLFAVALGSMAYAMASEQESNLAIKVMLPLFAMGLFTCCMVCHGELARLKPHPRYLTQFYLMVSAGGALGGILVGLIAPHVFNAFYELPIGLAASAILVVAVLKQDPELAWFKNFRQPAPLVAAGLTVALVTYLGLQIRENQQGALVLVRNFYGGLKVRDSGPADRLDSVRSLTHGTINHGEEYLNPARRDWPTTYYGPNTGIGVAIRDKQKNGPIRVGVIGLGTGTISAYGRPGDYYRFYEINPLVPRLARTEFHFIPDSKAKLDIALGDARLSLEREQPENFDVLAVDAFSGDSIPVHLLTREAFELYFRHLKPGGVLAVHVSNKYLDLEPVVDKIAASLHKEDGTVDTEDDDAAGTFGSTWVLVSERQDFFQNSLIRGAVVKVKQRPGLRMWTDDYSNLF